MSPAAIQETRERNAMSEAFRAAKIAAPKKPAQPRKVKPAKAPRARAKTPEGQMAELVAQIKVRARLGMLDLSKSASELVAILGANDERQLTAAMASLGYVRVFRGIPAQILFRGKA